MFGIMSWRAYTFLIVSVCTVKLCIKRTIFPLIKGNITILVLGFLYFIFFLSTFRS